MKLSREELKGLMKNKLVKAGLNEKHADIAAEVMTWSDERIPFTRSSSGRILQRANCKGWYYGKSAFYI